MNKNNERIAVKFNFSCPQCFETVTQVERIADLPEKIMFYAKCPSKHDFNIHVYYSGEFEVSYWTNELPEYREYINSAEWKNKSKTAKEKSGWKCQLCNKTGTNSSLHTHHRTYENLGDEIEGDLIVLCSECHAKFHDKVLA